MFEYMFFLQKRMFCFKKLRLTILKQWSLLKTKSIKFSILKLKNFCLFNFSCLMWLNVIKSTHQKDIIRNKRLVYKTNLQ